MDYNYQLPLYIVVARLAVMIYNRIVALYFVWKYGNLITLLKPSRELKGFSFI